MLGRLILLLLQIVIGWFGSNALMAYIQAGDLRLFIFATVAAVVVFVIGLIAGQVVKDVSVPSGRTVSSALLLAFIAAALWTFGPGLLPDIPWARVLAEHAVLAGAIIGYHLKK